MASGVMQIKYGEERIASRASKACNELEDICGSLSKVRKKLNNLPERSRGGDNLSSASAFLKKKQKQYDKRQDALEVLKTRSNSFMSKVETTEKKLSSQMKKEYKKFHKQTGIGKTRVAAILEGVGKGAIKVLSYLIPVYGTVKLVKDLCEVGAKIGVAIKNWYNSLPEGLRFALEAIGAVAVAVVAVIGIVTAIGAVAAAATAAALAFAIVAAAGAIIVGADAILGACKNISEAGLYFSGNKAAARELDSASNAEVFGPALGMSPEMYNNIQTFGTVCSLVGSIGGFAVKIRDGVPKMVSKFGTMKDKIAAYKHSFNLQVTDKIKGLFGADDFISLKDYVHNNGLKALFTDPIKLADKEMMDALKGIKTLYSWATLSPLKDIHTIYTQSSWISAGWEAFKVFI